MMNWLRLIFTWWGGTTWGTSWFTLRRGVRVGSDSAGNTYYRDRKYAKKRWVIYADDADASAIPPGWHGWMHGTTDESPADVPLKSFDWERPHQKNPTGSAEAYHPEGSLLAERTEPSRQKPYEAWQPE